MKYLNLENLKTIIAECQKIFAGIKHKHTTSDVTGLDETLKNVANIVYITRDEYDQLEKNGALDSNATYVTTDGSDNITDSSVQLWNTSSSLAQQGKYLSYSDQNGGKYLSLMNSSDNTAVAHAKLMDGESGEGMDVDANKVKTVDSKGILVEALGETTAQALIDEVAKRVIDLTGRMSTTETGLQSANDAITSLNSDLGKEYWGGVETYNISSVNAWVKGAKSLVLPAGTYIIGYRADTNCDNGIYIDTGINTSNLALPLFEKNINIPPSNLNVNMATFRSANNTAMITLANETTLFFYCWSTSPIVIQYELWAMRIK